MEGFHTISNYVWEFIKQFRIKHSWRSRTKYQPVGNSKCHFLKVRKPLQALISYRFREIVDWFWKIRLKRTKTFYKNWELSSWKSYSSLFRFSQYVEFNQLHTFKPPNTLFSEGNGVEMKIWFMLKFVDYRTT